MGTLITGPIYTPAQWHRHEGHPGWQINEVDEILNKSLATSARPPDLITIHLGTNDCDAKVPPINCLETRIEIEQLYTRAALKWSMATPISSGYLLLDHPGQLPATSFTLFTKWFAGGKVSTSEMVARMSSLLEHIAAATPKASVFLADVIGTGAPEGFNDCIKSFNAEVPGLVNRMIAKGMSKLYFVPMYNETGICGASDVSEDHALCGGHQIHPTAAGYLRMSSAFARVILQNF